MSQHARPTSGRGGGRFVLLAFVVLAVGAYLANAVGSNSQRPAIGLAALAAAGLALVSARAERQTRQQIEELTEARRRDGWRMRSELDEAHARSHRALQRAVAAESAVQTLMAATESLLAVRHALIAAATAAPAAAPAPTAPAPTAPAPTAPAPAATAPTRAATGPAAVPATSSPVLQPAAAAFTPTFVPQAAPVPSAPPAPLAPAAALTPPTLIWPLADLPAAQREPSLDLPLVPAPGGRVSPRFVPVESPRRAVASTTATAGTEPLPVSELVDLSSTVTTRYARPA
jgi:hypothetical protein